jgi:oligoendopeptidase F
MFGFGHSACRGAAVTSLALALTLSTSAQERERSQIADKHKWNLAEIYPSDETWREAKDALVAALPGLEAYKGTLGSSAARLADALDALYGLSKDLSRTYVYASLKSDQDTRVSLYQGMQQEMLQIASRFSAAAAFVEPAILSIGKA